MVVAILQIELTIPSADSLKAKRMVLRSLRDRIRRNFNISIAEVGENDQWSSAMLAVVMVSDDRRFANKVLSRIVNLIKSSQDLIVDDYQLGLV